MVADMTPTIQIAIDAADPHALARFWAAAAGYELEDHSAIVDEMLGAGYATRDDAIEVDGKLQWATAAACHDPGGARPRLLFQQVPEPKTVKDRIHLDLHVGPDQRVAEVARIVALGATKLWDGEQGPYRWVTLADPEGNEFCVG
jgi:hypothetical protein